MIISNRLMLIILFATLAGTSPGIVSAQGDEDTGPPPAWVSLSLKERKAVLVFAESYKDFMSRAKTEMSFVSEALKIVEAAGFRIDA